MVKAVSRKESRIFAVEEFVPSSAWTEDSDSHCLHITLPGFNQDLLKIQVDEHGQILASGEKQVSETKIVRFEQTFKVPENSDTENITGQYEGEFLYIVVPKKVKEERNGTTNGVEEKHEPEGAATPERVKGTVSASGVEQKQKHEHEHEHEHTKEAERVKGTSSGVNEKHKHTKEAAAERVNKGIVSGVEKKHEQKHDGGNSYRYDENMRKVAEEGFQEASREVVGVFESVVEILSMNKGIVAIVVLAFSLGVFLSQKFQSNIGTEGPFSPV